MKSIINVAWGKKRVKEMQQLKKSMLKWNLSLLCELEVPGLFLQGPRILNNE